MLLTEPNELHLRFLGSDMGTLAYRPDLPAYALALSPEFLAQGHDLSPFALPMETFRSGVRIFRPADTPFVGGLPGLIADSLPDVWGERMLRQEIPGLKTTMAKLAAIGHRGPGAITFEPVLGAGADQNTTSAQLNRLAREADGLRDAPVSLTNEHVNTALAKGGSSLGGKFPKIAAYLPQSSGIIKLNTVLVGGPPHLGHSPCILKLASSTDEAEGAVEYAYWIMAQKAGIRVPPAWLVDDGERLHFASERFDRYQKTDGNMGRRHVHTLSGMLHRRASDGAIDYEDFLRLSRALGGVREAEECFRRAVFNLLAVNRDDHGRNHAFLYFEDTRNWTLAPAYDLNPSIANVLIGLSWLGGLEIPQSFSQLTRMAEQGDISRARARDIYEQVEVATIGGWRAAAKHARVPETMVRYWENEMSLQTRALQSDFSVNIAVRPSTGPKNELPAPEVARKSKKRRR